MVGRWDATWVEGWPLECCTGMWSVRQDVLTRVVEALAVKLRAPSMYILETELNHILTFNIEHTSPHIPNTQHQRSAKHLYYPSQKYVESPRGTGNSHGSSLQLPYYHKNSYPNSVNDMKRGNRHTKEGDIRSAVEKHSRDA